MSVFGVFSPRPPISLLLPKICALVGSVIQVLMWSLCLGRLITSLSSTCESIPTVCTDTWRITSPYSMWCIAYLSVKLWGGVELLGRWAPRASPIIGQIPSDITMILGAWWQSQNDADGLVPSFIGSLSYIYRSLYLSLSLSFFLSLSRYIYIYVCIYIYLRIYTYILIYKGKVAENLEVFAWFMC